MINALVSPEGSTSYFAFDSYMPADFQHGVRHLDVKNGKNRQYSHQGV
jgi:hypothetical protein